MLLAESEQEIPEFLEQYRTEAEAEIAATEVDGFGAPIPAESGGWGAEDSAEAPEADGNFGKEVASAAGSDSWPPQDNSSW